MAEERKPARPIRVSYRWQQGFETLTRGLAGGHAFGQLQLVKKADFATFNFGTDDII